MGREPRAPQAPSLPRSRRTPSLSPGISRAAPSLPAPPQNPKARRDFGSGLGLPCSTLTFSGHIAPGNGVARNNIMYLSCAHHLSGWWLHFQAGLAMGRGRARTAPSCTAQHPGSSPSWGPHPQPGWPRAETALPWRGAGPLHMVALAGSQRWGRCSRLGYTKPYCRHPQGFPPRAGTSASPCRSPRPGTTRKMA